MYVLESVVPGHRVYKRIWTPHVGEQLRLKHENNENDLRAVAVVKDIFSVSFEYYRRLIWYEKYSCSASYDNFPSKVHTRDMQLLRQDMCYDDVIFFKTKCIAF